MNKENKELLSHCGYRCDLCPALQATQKNDFDALSKLGKEWEQLFGFHKEPEQLECDGCIRSSGRRVEKNCPVRPCCMKKGFKTCVECSEYPCDHLRKRFVDRNEVEKELGRRIPDEIYVKYVQPFESKARLDKISKKLAR
jgi:hypothetical protein